MSKIIWVCSRLELGIETEQKLESILEFITPDNFIPNVPQIKVDAYIAYGILNPKSNIKYHGNGVMLGAIFGEENKWHEPLSEIPDGSFALFRDNESYVEIISDAAGSRTIWYYYDEELIIASTSQFAIIKYLEDFKFNENVIPWMLSTGTLGPDNSWDTRIKKLPPESSIILEKKSWHLKIKSVPFEYNTSEKTESELKQDLVLILNKTLKHLKVDFEKWILPLSGGYDSRGILFLFKTVDFKSIKTITWGIPQAINDNKSDAFIAKKIAENLQVEHKFYETDFSGEPIKKIVKRFIKNGEGRIDHISGYLDGFSIWKKLHEDKIEGIIRGDENFGWYSVHTSDDVYNNIGINFCKDYPILNDYLINSGHSQILPDYLKRIKDESLEKWRDRLYHQYRIQNIIAPLVDLKLGYLEQINPLLGKSVLESIRSQPDHLRTNKVLWKRIVDSFEPKIEYATRDAIANFNSILRSKLFIEFLIDELQKVDESIFNKDFVNKLKINLKISEKDIVNKSKLTPKRILKILIPSKIYSLIKEKTKIKSPIDFNQLAFRIIIINEVFRTLNQIKK